MTGKKIKDGEQNDGVRYLRVQLRGQFIGESQMSFVFNFSQNSECLKYLYIGHKNVLKTLKIMILKNPSRIHYIVLIVVGNICFQHSKRIE